MDVGGMNYQRYLAGDEEGLHELVDIYWDGLKWYINSIIHNIHDSEDIAEDVFVELMVKKPAFSGASSFKTWLYSIGHHLLLKRIKKHPINNCLPLDNELPDNDTPEKQILRDEERKQLYMALAYLKEEYRQVLYLTYLEGFDINEVCRIMKKKRKQIENLLYRAKSAVREEMGKGSKKREE